jgi:hypothetical protein
MWKFEDQYAIQALYCPIRAVIILYLRAVEISMEICCRPRRTSVVTLVGRRRWTLLSTSDASVGAFLLRIRSVGSSGSRKGSSYGGMGLSDPHTHLGWFTSVRWFGRDDDDMRLLFESRCACCADYNSYHAVAAIFVSMLELIDSKLLVYRGSFDEEVLSV